MGVLCSGFSCCDGLIFVYFRPAGSHKGPARAAGSRVCAARTLPAGRLSRPLHPIHNAAVDSEPGLRSFSECVLVEAGVACGDSLWRSALVCGRQASPSACGAPPTPSSSRAERPGLSPGSRHRVPVAVWEGCLQEDAPAHGVSHSRR